MTPPQQAEDTATSRFQDEQHPDNSNKPALEDAADLSTSSMAEEEESSIGNSQSRNTSSHPDATHTDTSQEDSAMKSIAKEETLAVFRLRVVVIVVLMVTAAVVSAVVLKITKNGEVDELVTQYEGAAFAIKTAFQGITEKLSVLSALGVVEMSDLSAVGFPFQLLHNFNKRAANARYTSGALSVSYCPIVTVANRERWEYYVNGEDSTWISDAYTYQEALDLNEFHTSPTVIQNSYIPGFNQTVDPIKTFDEQGKARVAVQDGPYLPIWQTSPLLQRRIINHDILTQDFKHKFLTSVMNMKQALLGSMIYAPFGTPNHTDPDTSTYATYLSIKDDKPTHYLGDPLSYFYLPIFEPVPIDYHLEKHNQEPSERKLQHDEAEAETEQANVNEQRTVVGVLEALIEWRLYFQKILKNSIPPMVVVLQNKCGILPYQVQEYSFQIQGQEAYILGKGDLHNTNFDSWVRQAEFDAYHLRDGTVDGVPLDFQQGCKYSIKIYPTQLFMDTYNTETPLAITFAIGVVFVFTICLFVLYDRLVEQRQSIVLRQAQHTTAIVSSLFPKNVRDRLLATAEKRGSQSFSSSIFSGNKTRLKGFLDDGESVGGDADGDAAPIADLFPECTVFFADIAGFTAWSSTREPEQVFVLLQTVYQKFDLLAKRRKVFKVETIGDSYMAVTGLPEPMINHAVTMVRFAWDCRTEFMRVTKDLEVSLGPDTTDLEMRFGLHSGPVTAGVLRGERARFQLFGDTVNTASRMESTGIRGKVQISETTAELLRKAGKEAWLVKRKDQVHAKGKGVIVTYWAHPKGARSSNGSIASDSNTNSEAATDNDRSSSHVAAGNPHIKTKKVNLRLVDWMTDLLLDHAKKMIYSRRKNMGTFSVESPTYFPPEGQTCLDEVKEEIEMPSFDANSADTNRDYRNVKIHARVVASLREYVLCIAQNYLDNPFHNFEHACHVTMSVNKLLKRIVAPELSEEELERLQAKDEMAAAAHLHDYTHGINSDPLLAFAITVSALIHDVDHRGVSNTRLIVEQPEMGAKYHEKSVAEQNSLDISWSILMEDRFAELRRVLFPTEEELLRFRQLLVNVVLATDIMDKELNGLRKRRWERAFSNEKGHDVETDQNLRATIVIEHIIQASDVSHTMQHWHVYRKWNQRLFEEVYKAYLDGRMDQDPSKNWYKGELGFFDFYIIPLAKKLKECRIFGVSSDEYLSYAEQNRAEWELRGEEAVAEMLDKLKQKEEEEED